MDVSVCRLGPQTQTGGGGGWVVRGGGAILVSLCQSKRRQGSVLIHSSSIRIVIIHYLKHVICLD